MAEVKNWSAIERKQILSASAKMLAISAVITYLLWGIVTFDTSVNGAPAGWSLVWGIALMGIQRWIGTEHGYHPRIH